MTPLANRLPTYILHELVKSCPHTLEPLINWLDHCGFWLEELNQHPRTPDQVPFMIGLLGLAVELYDMDAYYESVKDKWLGLGDPLD